MGPHVLRVDDPEGVAGQLLADAIGGLVATRGYARVAVSGGVASGAIGACRRSVAERGRAFERVVLTWTTQAAVPLSDPRSERGLAYRRGHLSADDPPGHELPLWRDDDTPVTALDRVTEELVSRFQGVLDVSLLCLGDDGSVAALYPDRPMLTGPVAFLYDAKGASPKRITLTAGLLATAAGNILLALGPGVEPWIDRILQGDPSLPTSALSGLIVITDRASSR